MEKSRDGGKELELRGKKRGWRLRRSGFFFFFFFFFLNHTRFNTPEGLCEIYIQYIDETQASRLFLVPSLTPLLPYTKKDLHSRALRTRIYEFSSSSSYSGSSVA